MKRWILLFPALVLFAALPLRAEDEAEPEEGAEPEAAAPEEGDGTVSAARGTGSKEEWLAQLKAALAKPETAASAVRELGPKIDNCEAIKLILRAAGDHGKNNADLLAACKDAIRQMDAAETLECLAGVKRMGLNSAAEALAYEIMGGLKIQDGPRISADEPSLYEQRRDALLDALSTTSYGPIADAAADALVKTGDKKAVTALIDRIGRAGAAGKKGMGSALQGLTGHSEKDAAGWRGWYDTEGFSRFPAPGDSGSKGDGASAGEDAFEAEYYGIPIKSKGMVFVIDASNSMSPEDSPNLNDFPKASPAGMKKANWVEQGKEFKSKDQFAKYELITTILQLPENARFNIVWFGGVIDSWPQEGQLIEATYENKNKAIERIRGQALSLGTKLIEGMEAAFKCKEVDTIFLLSDGKPERSKMMEPNDVIKAVKAECVTNRKIKVNTIDMNALPWLYKNKIKKEAHTGLCASLASATGGKTVIFDEPKLPFKVKTKVYRGPK